MWRCVRGLDDDDAGRGTGGIHLSIPLFTHTQGVYLIIYPHVTRYTHIHNQAPSSSGAGASGGCSGGAPGSSRSTRVRYIRPWHECIQTLPLLLHTMGRPVKIYIYISTHPMHTHHTLTSLYTHPHTSTQNTGKLCYYEAEIVEDVEDRRKPRGVFDLTSRCVIIFCLVFVCG